MPPLLEHTDTVCRDFGAVSASDSWQQMQLHEKEASAIAIAGARQGIEHIGVKMVTHPPASDVAHLVCLQREYAGVIDRLLRVLNLQIETVVKVHSESHDHEEEDAEDSNDQYTSAEITDNQRKKVKEAMCICCICCANMPACSGGETAEGGTK